MNETRNWGVFLSLVLGVVLFTSPALAARVDVAELDVIVERGDLLQSMDFDWFSGTTGFDIDLQNLVFFDDSVYTYVFTATVNATGDGAGRVVTGLTFGGDWDTVSEGLDWGLVTNNSDTTSGGTNFNFTEGDRFRALFLNEALEDGETIQVYAQSLLPPDIFTGDSLDGGEPAPFGENKGPIVPEPSTVALFGLGLGALALGRKRLAP